MLQPADVVANTLFGKNEERRVVLLDQLQGVNAIDCQVSIVNFEVTGNGPGRARRSCYGHSYRLVAQFLQYLANLFQVALFVKSNH